MFKEKHKYGEALWESILDRADILVNERKNKTVVMHCNVIIQRDSSVWAFNIFPGVSEYYFPKWSLPYTDNISSIQPHVHR